MRERLRRAMEAFCGVERPAEPEVPANVGPPRGLTLAELRFFSGQDSVRFQDGSVFTVYGGRLIPTQ